MLYELSLSDTFDFDSQVQTLKACFSRSTVQVERLRGMELLEF